MSNASIDDALSKLGQARALADVLMAATYPRERHQLELLADTVHRLTGLQFELLSEAQAVLDVEPEVPSPLRAVHS